MTGIFADPATWTGICLVLFLIVLVFARVPGAMARSLDTRASSIKSEIGEAERAAREAREDLGRLIERRKDQAQDKIARAQKEAVADIQKFAAGVSVGAARRYISDKVDGARAAKLVDAAIAELPAKVRSERFT